MAGLYTCYNFASVEEDKLARNISIKNSKTLILFFAISWSQTSASTQSLIGLYIDIDL